MDNPKKTGILGGTFNPVHNGHLILAQNALETLELEKVLFIPCARPPHKSCVNLIDARHRAEMIESAIDRDPRFELSEIELRRGGVSYAVDTLMELRSQFPDRTFYFIIGGDTLKELHLWRRIYDLLEMCVFAVFPRPPLNLNSIAAADIELEPPWPEKLLNNVFAGRRIEISSSEIRYRIAEGMSIRYLVPQAVEMYIAEHGLY